MTIKFPQWFRAISEQNNGCSNCERCLEILQLILDDEADEKQQRYFSKHIEICLPCLDHYKLDRAIKKIIQEKIEKKSVPSDLIESIRIKIGESLNAPG